MKRLILFDIDGTLLTTDGAAKRAFHRALLEVYGTAGPIGSHLFDGKTDPQIARELLREAGFPDAAIDGGFPRFWPSYLRELALELNLPGHRTTVLPGVHALLEALERRSADCVLGLLTGNGERGAVLKLAAAGIHSPFPVGAFGSDDERRAALPAVAVRRARERLNRTYTGADIVIIGDTPHDVACGRELGVRAVAVATGRHAAEDLERAGADLVLDDLSRTDDVVAYLTDRHPDQL
jgi:phosphoglycolate phosphatase